MSPKRCGILALKKNKKGRNKQAAFSCVCTRESVFAFHFSDVKSFESDLSNAVEYRGIYKLKIYI